MVGIDYKALDNDNPKARKVRGESPLDAKNATSTTEIQYDRRHPLYIGDWKRSLAWRDNSFAYDDLDDPHLKRRLTILQRYPEIASLYTNNRNSIPIGIFAILIQVVISFGFGNVWTKTSWPMFFIVAFVIGGSMAHILGILMHECAHCLASKSLLGSRLFGLILNIGIPVPIAISFRRYHLEHHTYQGVEGKDPDLPIPIELRLVHGNVITKLVWMFFYPALYAFRGATFGLAPSKWEVINFFWTIFTDGLIWYFCGFKGLFYLFASLWLGYSFHPCAAHFIQEHYTFIDGQETYSYYGWGNKLFLNIGYHNEHHDFPSVPWNLLPLITAIAPEFYTSLAAHVSWKQVLWDFLTDSNYGPQSRCVRDIQAYKSARKLVALKKHKQSIN